jgi:hypothetical protein
MTMLRKLALAALIMGVTSVSSAQEAAKDVGDYVIHYNAFRSDVLTPEIARSYGIVRSKTRALLNIVVLKKVMGTTGEPVEASVEASATNLTGQLKRIGMREVREGNAIYYLGDVRIVDEETLDFNIEVTPTGSPTAHTMSFRRQFFTR